MVPVRRLDPYIGKGLRVSFGHPLRATQQDDGEVNGGQDDSRADLTI